MRAAVYHRFGGPDTVRVEDVPRPSVGPDDVLLRVHASTVSVADHRARTREVPRGLGPLAALGIGTFRPKHPVLGFDAAGVVEQVGSRVERFRAGDEVIGMLGGRFGGHAEYARVRPGDPLARKPATWTFEDAVTLVFGGLTARGFLQQAPLAPGAAVLVNGASGAVGTAAVQLASHAGAHVTGVCSAANRELVTSLGADRVIDYTAEDFATEPGGYDVIVDCVGNAPYQRVRHSLRPGGALLLVITDLPGLLLAPLRSRRTGHVVTADVGTPTGEDLAHLVELAGAGSFQAVRDRTYDLADVAEAHRYVDTGRKRGNVVLRLTGEQATPSSTTTRTEEAPW
jgi:NADPH:quinone reductase-like Zn-dependent oxidoreductase